MQKTISPKVVAVTFGVLIVSFLAAFYVVAWQEPTQAPPQGNTAAPVNVSATAQIKEGDLTINGVLKTFKDMIINVVTVKGDGSISANLNSDKLDDYHAADLLAAGGGGKTIYYTKCSWKCDASYTIYGGSHSCLGSCTPPSCAAGDTLLSSGCAAMGGGGAPVSNLANCYGQITAILNGYGYCENVCRDE